MYVYICNNGLCINTVRSIFYKDKTVKLYKWKILSHDLDRNVICLNKIRERGENFFFSRLRCLITTFPDSVVVKLTGWKKFHTRDSVTRTLICKRKAAHHMALYHFTSRWTSSVTYRWYCLQMQKLIMLKFYSLYLSAYHQSINFRKS